MTKKVMFPRWLRGSSSAASDEFLAPREAMWSLLEYERLRADRSGAVFSLLTLQAPKTVIPRLSRVLRGRLRSTDLAGLLHDDQIGVFLPDTPEYGAWKVAGDVLAQLPAEAHRPACDVYVYPHPWWPGGREPVQQESELLVGSRTNGSHMNGNGQDRRAGDNGRASGHDHAAENGRAGAHADEKTDDDAPATQSTRARSLNTLLAQPLPAWKRSLDVVASSLGLLALSPLLVVAGATVKTTSRGPMFFLQEREGLGGRVFWMVKFRTMVQDADAVKGHYANLNEQDGPAFKIDNDPRLTAIGKLLRKTNLDELPQLWNVLRGEMSLVGPRPLPVAESLACTAWQRRRLDVTPGMTGVWQAQPRRNSIKFADWMRMDLAYASRRSLKRDLSLILKTIRAFLLRRGQ
jgi:lipopolysaccharide/colanic/teichoic acid biosynthesis glycosyltransferase